MNEKVKIRHIYVDSAGRPGIDEFDCPVNFVPDFDAEYPDEYVVAFSLVTNGSRIAEAWKESQEPGRDTKVLVAAPFEKRDQILSGFDGARDAMRELIFDGLQPHLGGLRLVRAKDYNHYQLLHEYRYAEMKLRKLFKGNERPSPQEYAEAMEGVCSNQQGMNYTASHPLWPRVRWIHGITPGWFSALLYLMEDPYWYVDPAFPKRSYHWKQRLGVYHLFEALTRQTDDISVLRTVSLLTNLIFTVPACDPEQLQTDPKLFFQRYHLRYYTGYTACGEPDDGVGSWALIKAVTKLANWLWLNWLETALPKHSVVEVDTKKFFAPDVTTAAYAEHNRIW